MEEVLVAQQGACETTCHFHAGMCTAKPLLCACFVPQAARVEELTGQLEALKTTNAKEAQTKLIEANKRWVTGVSAATGGR